MMAAALCFHIVQFYANIARHTKNCNAAGEQQNKQWQKQLPEFIGLKTKTVKTANYQC